MSGFRRVPKPRGGRVRPPVACALVLVLALAAASGPRPAMAQGTPAPPSGDKAAAEVLFNEGRTLLGQNRLNEACPKLAESNRLDTGIGTMLYLAECYERSGKTASAWAQFREAQSIAAREKDAREKVARARADKLEPKLSRLTIVVAPDAEVADLAITRDGVGIGRALWGEDTPVDPGVHVVRATAPGRAPFEAQVTVQAGAPKARVVIPALEPASAGETTDPGGGKGDAGASRDDGTTSDDGKLPPRKIVALGLGGVGVVGLAVGTIFGLRAMGTLDDAEPRCNAQFCDQQGLDLRDEAKGQALVSTISFVVGTAAAAAGIVLWVTTPKGAPTRAQATLVPVPLPGGGAFAGAIRF